jgi:hypothetical protein
VQENLLGEEMLKKQRWGVKIPFMKRARVCKTEDCDVMLGREDAAYL